MEWVNGIFDFKVTYIEFLLKKRLMLDYNTTSEIILYDIEKVSKLFSQMKKGRA